MEKRGLVLGGGGAKGSYEMGVWRALRELGMDFDLIVGTSIGAINGALMVQGDFERASKLWSAIEYKKIFSEERNGIDEIETTLDLVRYALSDYLLEGSLDTTALEVLLRDYINEEIVRNSKIAFGLVAVEIPSMRGRTLMMHQMARGRLIRYLMASSACFPVFKPVEVGSECYIDGGYFDNLPINFALDQGAQYVVAVDLEAFGMVREPKADDASITRIKPYWELGAVFSFDQNLYARNRLLGYYDTLKTFGRMEGMYYTFEPGESKKNYMRCQNGLPEAIARVERMIRRPVARVFQTMDRKAALNFLARGSWEREGPAMLCRVAELAGRLYESTPEQIYSFDSFNRRLQYEYRKFGGATYREDEAGDITHILASASASADRRQLAARIARIMLGKSGASESILTLSELMPQEFIAAIYLTLMEQNNLMTGE